MYVLKICEFKLFHNFIHRAFSTNFSNMFWKYVMFERKSFGNIFLEQICVRKIRTKKLFAEKLFSFSLFKTSTSGHLKRKSFFGSNEF